MRYWSEIRAKEGGESAKYMPAGSRATNYNLLEVLLHRSTPKSISKEEIFKKPRKSIK